MRLILLPGLLLTWVLSTAPVGATGPAGESQAAADHAPASQTRASNLDGVAVGHADSLLADSAGWPNQADSDSGFFRRWFARVAHSQAEQPHWITPLVSVTPRLEQEFRFDMSWQTQPNGTRTLANFGGSKGLEIIPADRVELIFSPPPYIVRSVNGVPDGYGDISFLLKYRFFSGNEEHGNTIFTAFLGGSIPTGSHTNGAKDAAITPTLAGGKGWGNFDVTTTFGVILPVGETNLFGRLIVWNTAFQYRLLRKFWPELEVNSTFFSDGPNGGKRQSFLTPALVLGRFPLWQRLGVTAGGGVQIAATRFHAYNHKWILTVRFPL